ncbi:MAG: ankyrin repeat domain-containing protein, partial [Planctomycetales bacterium]|nr:ankyrin repeat domain-containing protein [Planctomycetales bacterium]
DINLKGGTSESSPLDRACADGQYDVVKYLLDKGAKIDVSAPERNPLFGAILSGNLAIAKLLIDRGIDTSVRYSGESMHDMSAIDFAKERGADEFVCLLGG